MRVAATAESLAGTDSTPQLHESAIALWEKMKCHECSFIPLVYQSYFTNALLTKLFDTFAPHVTHHLLHVQDAYNLVVQ